MSNELKIQGIKDAIAYFEGLVASSQADIKQLKAELEEAQSRAITAEDIVPGARFRLYRDRRGEYAYKTVITDGDTLSLMGVDFNPFKFYPSLYPFIPSNTTAAECAQYLNEDGYEKDPA